MTDDIINKHDADADSAAELDIPGTCYTRLLDDTPVQVFTGRWLLLASFCFIFISSEMVIYFVSLCC